MALKRAEMCGAAESARIRALSAAGGRVYEWHHPKTRYEAKGFLIRGFRIVGSEQTSRSGTSGNSRRSSGKAAYKNLYIPDYYECELERPGEDVRIALRNGRNLCVRIFGNPDKPLVLYFGGLISSRLEAVLFRDDRFFVVGIDRPGYGQSDFNPVQDAVTFAADAAEILREFGKTECRIFAFSGGLPFALAFASARPDLVLKIGGFAGLSPAGSVPVGKCYIAKFPFFTAHPSYLRLNAAWRCLLYRLPPRLLRLLLSFDRSRLDVEKQALKSPALEVLTASFREVLRPGTKGLLADLRLYLGNWGGFDLRQVRTPVLLFHGCSDHITPIECSHWYEQNLENCSARYFEGETHLSVPLLHLTEMFDWLYE